MQNFNSFEEMEPVVCSLVEKGGGKNLSSAWDILGGYITQHKDVTLKKISNLYKQLVDKWGDSLPANLVRKEMKNKNYACVIGICLSDNINVINFTFVSLLQNNFFELKVELKDFPELLLYRGKAEVEYYKMLLYILLVSNPDYNQDDGKIKDYIEGLVSLVDFRLYFDDFQRLYFKDNSFTQKMKRFFPESGLPCNFAEYSNYGWVYDWESYEKECWDVYPIESLLSMEKILRKNLTKKARANFRDDNIIAGGVIFINGEQLKLGKRNSMQYFYTKLSIFLWLQKGIVPEIKSILSKEYYIDDKKDRIASIILSKPFFLPYSEESLDFIEMYFGFSLPKFIAENKDDCYGKSFEEIWRLFLQNFIESQAKNVKSIDNFDVSLSLAPEYEEYILSRTDDFFPSGIETLMFLEYKAFLNGCRKNTITKLAKKGCISETEQEKLLELTKKDDAYYAWSDEELFSCFGEKKTEEQMNLIHTELEPDFMSHIFEKSLHWIIFHKDSELWETAPWIGMKIFVRSYADRPSIWAKHLLKFLKNDFDELSEDMIVQICFALGHLREPLGNDVPVTLQECAEKQKDSRISKIIMRQRALFNRASFNRGHHKNAKRRVSECIDVLIKGQNEEVNKTLTKK